jgi:hypothetical protein
MTGQRIFRPALFTVVPTPGPARGCPRHRQRNAATGAGLCVGLLLALHAPPTMGQEPGAPAGASTAATAIEVASDAISAPARTIASEDALADLDLARDALEAIHPGYDRYTARSELDRAWEALHAALEAPASVSTILLYRGLSAVLARIRCDHTLAELPPVLQEERRQAATYFPFRLRLFDGRAYVFGSADPALKRGDEILAIDTHPMGDIIAQILPLLPVDGFTDAVRPRTFEASGEFSGAGFEHFYPVLHGTWWNRGGATITFRDGETGNLRAHLVQPVPLSTWRDIDWGGPAAGVEFHDGVSYEILERQRTGVLTVDSFVNYRNPVDPETVYAPIFGAFRAAGVDTLILDTRNNGGGSDDAMLGLLAWLTSGSFQLLAEQRVNTIDLSPWTDHIDTWDPAALVPDPARFEATADGGFTVIADDSTPMLIARPGRGDAAWTDRMLVLTGARNSSAVTMMLSHLEQRPATLLVGEPTGGSSTGPTAGIIFFLELPNSRIKVRVPWIRQQVAGAGTEGRGMTPAMVIETTLADALAGRDPAMEMAKRLAARKQRPQR